MPDKTEVTASRPHVFVSIKMHPEIHKALKVRAIMDEVSMTEKLHAILCLELGREDLMFHDPESSQGQ